VPTLLQESSAYAYLQPAESAYEGVTPTKFSAQVKSGLAMKELLTKAHRCPICKGVVPTQALSIDHIRRRNDGGTSTVDNAQVTHPYCNTGYKEQRIAKGKQLASNT
jgi:5-methylcytosine-specific restriction endonuclease McrA